MLGIARARKGQGASKRVAQDDNLSKTSHKVFDDPEEWNSFVQTRTGLAPPEPEAAEAGSEQVAAGEQLIQQEAGEAESQGRRRTEQLLGPTAASALGKRDIAVLPKLPQPSAVWPIGNSQPAPQIIREDLWNENSGLPTQPAHQSAVRPATAKADTAAAAAAVARTAPKQDPDDEAEEWWSQLEQVGS